MQEDALHVFHEHRHHHDEHDAAAVQKQVHRSGAHKASRAVHVPGDQHDGAEQDSVHSEEKQNVRWTDDLDVQPVSVVPPVVKRSGGEHHNSAPRGNESA